MSNVFERGKKIQNEKNVKNKSQMQCSVHVLRNVLRIQLSTIIVMSVITEQRQWETQHALIFSRSSQMIWQTLVKRLPYRTQGIKMWKQQLENSLSDE